MQKKKTIICENRLVRIVPENRGDSQNGEKKFKESGRFLEPAPKTRANYSHENVRTAQHWSRPQNQVPKNSCHQKTN